jgi:MYXO-CTERM domain-containing protein
MNKALLRSPVVALALWAIADPLQAGFTYNAALSQASIAFEPTPAGAGGESLFGAFGAAWRNPNFLFNGPNYYDGVGLNAGFPPAAGPWSAYNTSVTHTIYNTGFNDLAVGINITPFSYLRQLDPGAVLDRAQLTINFQVVLHGNVLGIPGFGVDLLPAFYSMAYNVPAGSFGRFDGIINYTNISSGASVFQALSTGDLSGLGAGVSNMFVPGFGINAPVRAVNVLAGETLVVSGSLIWQANHNGGAFPVPMDPDDLGVDLTLTDQSVPGPGGMALVFLVGAAGVRRRRNA